MTDTMLNNRKVEVGASINVEVDRIKIVQHQLNVLRNKDILVDLSISGTGMFTRTATWAEIGIQADEADPRFTRLSRGQKYLIPEERIKRLLRPRVYPASRSFRAATCDGCARRSIFDRSTHAPNSGESAPIFNACSRSLNAGATFPDSIWDSAR